MPTLVIIGGGPAGLSAAIYAVRAGLDVHVLYKDDGALGKTDKIENYFGFPDVISGAELLSRGRAQAERLGAQLHRTEVTGIEYADTGFAVKTTDGERHADAVLLATGSPRAVPAITGIRTFEGRGVSYCAVCDAFFYRGRAAAVLGQGEYALEEARVLLPVAGSVTLLTNGQSAPENLPDGLAVDTRPVSARRGRRDGRARGFRGRRDAAARRCVRRARHRRQHGFRAKARRAARRHAYQGERRRLDRRARAVRRRRLHRRPAPDRKSGLGRRAGRYERGKIPPEITEQKTRVQMLCTLVLFSR